MITYHLINAILSHLWTFRLSDRFVFYLCTNFSGAPPCTRCRRGEIRQRSLFCPSLHFRGVADRGGGGFAGVRNTALLKTTGDGSQKFEYFSILFLEAYKIFAFA